MNMRTIMSVGTFLAVFVFAFAFASPGPIRRANAQSAPVNGGARPATTFTNATPITINDHAVASPYPSTILVSGLTGTVTHVKVTINGYSHTFSDDVAIALVGPGGGALLLQDGCGDAAENNVTYSLDDNGATTLPNVDPWAAGTYKPTTYFTGDSFPPPGPGTTYGNPGPAGGGTATFASTYNGIAPNGNWNLFVEDLVSGDTGTIAGGWSIDIQTNGGTVAPQHVIDFDADGKTDFSIFRNTGGGTGGQETWFNLLNNGIGNFTAPAWGISTDKQVPVDFDGDHKTDIAVWRPGANSVFYILLSATSTVRVDTFGVATDDPSVVGDYDGDGKADVAVYRAGAATGQQSFWYYRGSLNNPGGNITFIQWGQNGDFPAPGDYDGDGRADACVQRSGGGGSGIFYTRLANGVTLTPEYFGTASDVIVPGDYDGDGITDIAIYRGSAGSLLWAYDPSSVAGTQPVIITWGLSATDFPVQGDYDGDGKTDVAVWRPSSTPGQSAFYVLKSSNGALLGLPWGQLGDLPTAFYNHH